MKTCPECGGSIIGRADKKFCSDECRAAFNDRIYRERRKEISRINRILIKNYSILKGCFERGDVLVSPLDLIGQGFHFEYFTSIHDICMENDSVWVGCYSFSYTVNEDGTVKIRRDP